MVENVEKTVNIVKNIKKIVKFDKIHPFLTKINPYAHNEVSEVTGEYIDSIYLRVWRPFSEWVINLLLNGFFALISINTVFLVFTRRPALPLNTVVLLLTGATVWFLIKLVSSAYDRIVEGRVKVVRNMPKMNVEVRSK